MKINGFATETHKFIFKEWSTLVWNNSCILFLPIAMFTDIYPIPLCPFFWSRFLPHMFFIDLCAFHHVTIQRPSLVRARQSTLRPQDCLSVYTFQCPSWLSHHCVARSCVHVALSLASGGFYALVKAIIWEQRIFSFYLLQRVFWFIFVLSLFASPNRAKVCFSEHATAQPCRAPVERFRR